MDYDRMHKDESILSGIGYPWQTRVGGPSFELRRAHAWRNHQKP